MSIDYKPNLSMLLLAILLGFRIAVAEDVRMDKDQWLAHGEVKELMAHDTELCQAIDRARSFFDVFRRAFANPAAAQSNFIVVCLKHTHGELHPHGILVEQIDGEKIIGRAVKNSVRVSPDGKAICNLDQVVDWHYTDTFELEGGELYLTLFDRQPQPVRRAIGSKSQFMLTGGRPAANVELEIDSEFRDLLRDVANLRYEEVEKKLNAKPSLQQREDYAPHPGNSATSPSICLRPLTVSEQAVHFGDARMVRLLHEMGILQKYPQGKLLLASAAGRGNVEATRCLLELGFENNIDVSDVEGGRIPLECAASWDRKDVVAVLLQHGADSNHRNISQETPLFFASSVEVAKLLLDAGARFDLVDDQGQSCVERLMDHGQVEVVQLLVQHGARLPRGARFGLNEEQTRAKGQEVIRKHLQSNNPDALSDFEQMQTVDYGCVLPVKSIQVEE